MYYWAIKWKNYSVGDLLVTPKAKEFIEAQWILEPDQRASKTFKYEGETYSYDSIDNITHTSKKINDFTKQLYSGQSLLQSRDPLVNEDGDVVTAWYKKLLTTKEYEGYYAKHPSYYTLDKGDGGIWVGMRLAVLANGDRPDTVELCTEDESRKLWKFLQVS
jgi:hypothetical protein